MAANIMRVRVPSELRMAVTTAAWKRLQSDSEFVRQALIDKIRLLEFEANRISDSDAASPAALRDLAKQSPVAA